VIKKVNSNNNRINVPSLVPKLNIDIKAELDDRKPASQRKNEIILLKKRSDKGVIKDRRFSSNSSQSSIQRIGSDSQKQRKVIYKRKIIKRSFKLPEDPPNT